MHFKITDITILAGNGPDHVMLNTNLPNGCWPYNGNASLRLEVASGRGVDYVKEHFPDVQVKVIKV